ncbi:MAG: DUF5930 domain-containing protein [Pseudorhodobacter sp.]
MLKRLSYRINTALGRYLPEQRLFLKSDAATRFIRLSPATQAVAITGGVVAFGWTLLATSILVMDSISAGSAREQTLRRHAVYESRLNALSVDRDLRAEEAVRAQERFNLALAEVSKMQTRLLASEDQRREMETGIDAVQETLRRTIRERDEARAEQVALTAALEDQSGSTGPRQTLSDETEATMGILADALAGTAEQRDAMALVAMTAKDEVEQIAAEKRQIEARNDIIFGKLEEAVAVSMEPLDKMFRAAGMSPDSILDTVRRGYSGQGGPLSPFTMSTSNAPLSADEVRARAILNGLDRMNMYRIAADQAPFAMPVKGAFRHTSGYGYRRDPKGAGTRMHSGTDFAAGIGTPIYATADGVVEKAGWGNGYGRMVKIKHQFGVQTLFAHMSKLRVKTGQKVSRGDHIGDMGSSGRSTGSHLHYEVRVGGNPVNAMTFIKAAKNVF